MSLTTTRCGRRIRRRIVDSFGRKRFSRQFREVGFTTGDACSQEERGPSIFFVDGDGVSIIVADRVPVKQARPSAGSSSDETASLNRLRCPKARLRGRMSANCYPGKPRCPEFQRWCRREYRAARWCTALLRFIRGSPTVSTGGHGRSASHGHGDGTVGNIKVVAGAPVLAQSAVDAVKNWRYEPFQLDGNPVKNATTITIDFKFPGPGH